MQRPLGRNELKFCSLWHEEEHLEGGDVVDAEVVSEGSALRGLIEEGKD